MKRIFAAMAMCVALWGCGPEAPDWVEEHPDSTGAASAQPGDSQTSQPQQPDQPADPDENYFDLPDDGDFSAIDTLFVAVQNFTFYPDIAGWLVTADHQRYSGRALPRGAFRLMSERTLAATVNFGCGTDADRLVNGSARDIPANFTDSVDIVADVVNLSIAIVPAPND